MRFETPLIEARLVRRYKRFLADVELADGRLATAHCANSGAMTGCAEPGSAIWLSPNRNPKAKLDYRWELVAAEGTLVCINTARPNRIVEEAVAAGAIRELAGYGSIRREVRYGANSRIDLLLAGDAGDLCYVEVKNVTLRRGDEAQFPDAVTARGTKHLNDLAAMVAQGHRAVMLYLVNRADCAGFAVAEDVDPGYAATLERAMQAGVEAYAYGCRVTPQNVDVAQPLPIRRLSTYPAAKRA